MVDGSIMVDLRGYKEYLWILKDLEKKLGFGENLGFSLGQFILTDSMHVTCRDSLEELGLL